MKEKIGFLRTIYFLFQVTKKIGNYVQIIQIHKELLLVDKSNFNRMLIELGPLAVKLKGNW